MRVKTLCVVLLAAFCFAADQLWSLCVQPELLTDVALGQMERSAQNTMMMRTASQAQQWPVLVMCSVFVIGTLLIFLSDKQEAKESEPEESPPQEDKESRAMKHFIHTTSMLAALVVLSGCMKPYHEPVLAEISNSQEGFLIELEGDNEQADTSAEEYLRSRLVQQKRIEIPYRWKQTWRMAHTGKWIPSARLVVADRAPENRLWVADGDRGTSDRNEAIWLESKDSVSFSTGIAITARIETRDDAVKFLANYPARPQDNADPEQTYQIKVSSLAQIMDEEIKNKVQAILSDRANEYDMDELRDRKNDIMSEVRDRCQEFFKQRGITITTLGMAGGFTYANPNIQEAIDSVFEAQQDKSVAIAEAAAAGERKEALKLQGTGQAERDVEIARGKAQAMQEIADAKAYEIEKLSENPEAYIMLKQLEIEMARLDRWNGSYPQILLSGGEGSKMPMLMMGMPRLEMTAEKSVASH
jgi:hypothetical protein